jgi:hypothetical protein
MNLKIVNAIPRFPSLAALEFADAQVFRQGRDCHATEIETAVRRFDAFTPDNDPHGEHDFGAIEFGTTTYFFKIDYYDLSKTVGSPDPADLAVTHPVLSIMRADEY